MILIGFSEHNPDRRLNKEVKTVPNRELLLQYTRDLLRLKGIQESLAELLVEILRKANYDNQIILNATIKNEMGENMGYSLGTIDNALTRFVNDGLLIREGRGVYLPNKDYFWKRAEEDQIERIYLNVNYEKAERLIAVKLQTKSEDEKV